MKSKPVSIVFIALLALGALAHPKAAHAEKEVGNGADPVLQEKVLSSREAVIRRLQFVRAISLDTSGIGATSSQGKTLDQFYQENRQAMIGAMNSLETELSDSLLEAGDGDVCGVTERYFGAKVRLSRDCLKSYSPSELERLLIHEMAHQAGEPNEEFATRFAKAVQESARGTEDDGNSYVKPHLEILGRYVRLELENLKTAPVECMVRLKASYLVRSYYMPSMLYEADRRIKIAGIQPGASKSTRVDIGAEIEGSEIAEVNCNYSDLSDLGGKKLEWDERGATLYVSNLSSQGETACTGQVKITIVRRRLFSKKTYEKTASVRVAGVKPGQIGDRKFATGSSEGKVTGAEASWGSSATANDLPLRKAKRGTAAVVPRFRQIFGTSGNVQIFSHRRH